MCMRAARSLARLSRAYFVRLQGWSCLTSCEETSGVSLGSRFVRKLTNVGVCIQG